MLKVFGITLRKCVNFSLEAKKQGFNSIFVRLSFIFLSLFLFVSLGTHAQERLSTPKDVLPVATDTIPVANPLAQDTIPKDSVALPQKKSDIETTINYSARDSIFTSIDGKQITLYGNAKIIYGEIELDAEEIVIDYAKNTLTAHGVRDSLGQRIGYPIFKNGQEVYETKDIIYNFKTGRARITEVVTTQGEGFIHGETVFKNEKDEIFSIRNTYTTCNLEHPHFRIRSTKTKAIPNDKIVSGPFYFELNDIPLPLGFAFGMFPMPRKSKSGILFPSFGEERRRGFNIRGGGYFFDFSEYVKLALTADVYSKGAYAFYANSNYSKRYKYTGGFNLSFSKNNNSDQIENTTYTNDYRIAWTHTPQTKGTGRFSASVNAATSTFNQNNNLIYGYTDQTNSSNFNNITAKLSSNVSYSKRFTGTPFNIGLNMTHNQDLTTGQVDLSLPKVSVNMINIYPFQRRDGQPTALDNFSIGYKMDGSNQITNNLGRIPSNAPRDSIADFSLDNFGTFFKNGRKGIRHNIPLSYSTKFLKFFTLSPSFAYEEKWYFEKLDWRYTTVNGKQTLVADTIQGFNRIANYNVSASLNTRIYGMYYLKKGNIQAIRHIMNPNISFGVTPDFTKNENYFQEFQDTVRTFYRARHQGFVYGPSTTGKSGAIGFSLGNNLEAKIKSEKDTVARKVMLINNLSISSSYNIVADSFNLAPLSISANTNIKNGLVNVNLSASLDPYTYLTSVGEDGTSTERRINSLAWKGGSPGRITTATMAMGTNLNPKGRDTDQESREKISQSNLPEQDKQFLLNNPDAYVDFEIPWNLRVNYSLSYSHPLNQDPRITQSLQMSGDMSLSEKWKVTFNTGYHFESKEITQTDIGISRDLHCWTMRVNWVPFGRFQSLNFTIAVKSSLLQDLKFERRKPFFDNL